MPRVFGAFAARCSLGVLLLASCGPKPPARTALYGNLAELKRDIQSAQQANKLDHDAVVKLAQAVAERELTSAEGRSGAVRIRALRSCARPLRTAIERRAARKDDDIAAELTLILVEMHAAQKAELLNRYARSNSGAWRAVAARAAERPIDTDMRKTFFVDPDERVRRAAFHAALAVREPGELEALLDAARVDPDPQSQSLAIVAAGALGGERAVLSLKDLWAQADDATRIAIVDAWTEHASFVTGGARELALAAEGGGLAAVTAAYALSRTSGADSVLANARLRRDILDGSDDEKRLALSVAPMNSESEAAIAKAAKEASPELRVLALTRLTSIEARRSDAIRVLREVANAKPNSESELRAQNDALSALAIAGDTSIKAALIKNLQAPAVTLRSRAARGLTSLGDYRNAATALADDDADLRSEIACSVLARETAQR